MHSASEEIAMDNHNKMTSSSNNNDSVRSLKMTFKVPQNIDASYTTMYEEDEEEDHYEDEVKYDDEENHNNEEDEEEENSGEEDEADITIEEALPPPPALIKEGETAAEEIIIDKEVEGENELDISSNNNNDAETQFKYVQGMPSSSESWPERVNNFNGPRDNTKTATTSSSVLPPQQQILNQKQYAMAQFDPNENELEVIDTTLIAPEQDDGIEEEETVLVEGERQDGEEDEREDDEEVEVEDDEDKEEIEKEVDDQEEEGDDEGIVEEMVEEEGDKEEEMVEEEVEEEGDEEEQHEQEEAPEGEEGENQQQQQDIEEVEAAKSNAHADILPSALDSWCKISRWHPNEEFTHCSNSMDIPQAAVEDETFRKMYFFQTLVECCQKFFHADECENEDVCPNLNAVEEVGEIDVERQADVELEDEGPDDEVQIEDGTDESDEDEDVAEEEEEVTNEEEEEEEEVTDEVEEGEDASDESNNKSSSTEGQGVQIDEANEKTNWEGFDEDMSHQNVKHEPEQPSSSSIEAHDLSEAQGKDDYEGDGFGVMKYKLLRGKGEGGKSSANPFTTIGSGALVAAFLLLLSCCLCCLRYRRRRYAQSKRPSRGNYAALGRHDFFNGTFSDDVSYGKDSDDDISIESYVSDDGGHQTNLEMGGFHEFDANGGLTLEEING